jgi:hypothetical protein
MGIDDTAKDYILSMGDPVSEMGMMGTGGGWWIVIVVAVIVLLLALCCAVGVYRRGKKVQQEQEGTDGLDEPLITDIA